MYNTERHTVTNYWWFSYIKKIFQRKCTIQEDIEWHVTDDSVKKILKGKCTIQEDVQWQITDDSVET